VIVFVPAAPSPRHSRRAESEISTAGDATLVRVVGMLDEHFPGFGDLSLARTIVIDVSGIRFITSFGVRQWLRAMSSLPAHAHVYLTGCQRIFVEQLNMILNFGGRGQILTLLAPYRCTGCGNESDEVIDAVQHGKYVVAGQLPEMTCRKCNGRLSLDEMPETYFACLTKYGPRDVDPSALQLLAADPRAMTKQVVKSTAPAQSKAAKKAAAAAAAPVKEKTSIVPWVVIGVMLAGLAAGLYFLVGPS
jgi:hypothetical protein